MTHNFNVRGKLTVTVHSARDLTVKQLIGEMDPYVKFSVRTEKFQTPVAENGHRAPKWEYAFIANLQGEEDAIHLKIYNKGTVTDDLMSRTDVELPNLNLSGQPTWYSLRDPDNFQKACGEISMSLSFTGTGLPVGSLAYNTHTARTQPAGAPAPTPAVAPAPVASPVANQYQPPQQQYQPPPQQAQYQSPPPAYQPPPSQPIYQQPNQVPYQQPQPAYGQPGYPPQGQPGYQPPPPQPVYQQPGYPQPTYQPPPPQPVYQQPGQPMYQQPPPQVQYQPPPPQQTSMLGGFVAGVQQFANSVATSVQAATTTRGKFDSNGYLNIHPDVRAAGQDGFQHWVNYGYNEKRDIVLTTGQRGKWDGAGYLAIHPDVKNAGQDPFRHFQQYGYREGRDIAIQTSGSVQVAPIVSPTSIGNNRGKWDSNGYLNINPDVRNAGMDAFGHFTNYGYKEGRHIALTNGARGNFDPFGYLNIHPDVKNAGMNGWDHYRQYGYKEGRDIVITP